MLALVCGNVRDCCEDIGGMRRGALNTVAVVYATLAGLGIHIEVLQIIVEVDGAGAEVAAKQRGVRGEDGGDIDAALLAQRDCYPGKPFVELNNDRALPLVKDVLGRV